VAATLISSLARPIHFAGVDMPVSVSIGIGTAFAAGMDAGELMQKADIALYRAKDSGRHCFQVFEAGMSEELQEKDENAAHS
jgi:predicted signal transduction protein with EAL and GGDEF domain